MEDVKSLLLMIVGAIVVCAVLYDAFVTILSLKGGGPFTFFISRQIWKLLLAIHSRRSIHNVLSGVGPAMLVFVVCLWYLGLLLGWYCVFLAFDITVVESTSRVEADTRQIFYFVGTTISGLGYGDLIPNRFPWTLVSSLSAFSGTLLTTLAISYVIGVAPTALQRRTTANRIWSYLPDRERVRQRRAQAGQSEELHQNLMSCVEAVEQVSFKFAAYPVVQFFHSDVRSDSFSLALLELWDALYYLSVSPSDGPDLSSIEADRAVAVFENFQRNRRDLTSAKKEEEVGPQLPADLPVYGADLEDIRRGGALDWDSFIAVRRKLLKAIHYDGWEGAVPANT